MPRFGKLSKARLSTCHEDLQTVMNEVIKYIDISVICGHRGEVEQNAAFDSGNSKVRYPNSKHNSNPSMAVDICTYPIVWEDVKQHYYVAGYVKATADRLYQDGKISHKVRAGADWNKNYVVSDETFYDVFHFELYK